MRRTPYPTRWAASTILLVVLGGVFVLQSLFEAKPANVQFEVNYLFLNPASPWYFWIWQLFTFQFLHAGLLHIFANGLGIFMFGRFVEASLGERNFLAIYFSSGVIGGLAHLIFSLITGHLNPVIGASAGAFGLLAAFSVLNWSRHFTVLLYFVIPIRLCGKYLFYGAGLISLVFLIMGGGNIAHVAHLGGLLTGAAYLYFNVGSRFNFSGLFTLNRSGRRQRVIDVKPVRESFWKKNKTRSRSASEDLPPSEFISREVDPILDKIAEKGIHSLTERERKILESARSRMSRH